MTQELISASKENGKPMLRLSLPVPALSKAHPPNGTRTDAGSKASRQPEEAMEKESLRLRLEVVQRENESLQAELGILDRVIGKLGKERDLLLDCLIESSPPNAPLFGDDQEEEDDISILAEEALMQRVLSRLNSPSHAQRRGERKPGRSLTDHEVELEGSKRRRGNKASASDAVLKVQSVPLDDAEQPILPLTLGILTVHSLGTIVADRHAFHNARYILPVGFHTSRPYLSAFGAEHSSVYHSRIVDNGAGPSFEVVAEDHPERVFSASTSTGVWSAIVRQAQHIRSREYTNSASGPDYYGLSNATVAMLIERLPNSHLCGQYRFKRFSPPSVSHEASRTDSMRSTGSSANFSRAAPHYGSPDDLSHGSSHNDTSRDASHINSSNDASLSVSNEPTSLQDDE